MKKLLLISLITLVIFLIFYQLVGYFTDMENLIPSASLATAFVLAVSALIFKRFLFVRLETAAAIFAMIAAMFTSFSVVLTALFGSGFVSSAISAVLFSFASLVAIFCICFSFSLAFNSLKLFFDSKVKKILISSVSLAIIWGGIAIRVFLF